MKRFIQARVNGGSNYDSLKEKRSSLIGSIQHQRRRRLRPVRWLFGRWGNPYFSLAYCGGNPEGGNAEVGTPGSGTVVRRIITEQLERGLSAASEVSSQSYMYREKGSDLSVLPKGSCNTPQGRRVRGGFLPTKTACSRRGGSSAIVTLGTCMTLPRNSPARPLRARRQPLDEW